MPFSSRTILTYALSLFSLHASATENFGKITGTITTADGLPAAYVSVSLKETSLAALTNEQGFFTLPKVKPGTYTIVISAVGSKVIEKQIVIGNEQTVNLNEQLRISAKELQQV